MNGSYRVSGRSYFLLFLIIMLPEVFGLGNFDLKAQSVNVSTFSDLYDLLEENPMDTDSRYMLALAYYNQGNYKAALEQLSILEPVLSDNDEFTATYSNIKNEYNDELDREKERYLILLETVPVNKNIAQIIYANESEQNNFEYSENLILKYLEGYPDDTEMILSLADIYIRSGRSEDAYQQYQKLLSLQPDEESVEYKYYQLAAVLKKYSQNYKEYFEDSRADDAELWSAYVASQENDNESTIDYLNDYNGDDFTNPDITMLLFNIQKLFKPQEVIADNTLEEAKDALQFNECEKASELFEKYLNNYEGDADIFLDAAEANYCAEKYDTAAYYFTRYFDYADTTSELLKKRAYSYQMSGNNFQALDDYLYLESVSPEDEEVLQGLARTYKQAGLYDMSRKYYDKAIELYPTAFYILDESDSLKETGKRVNAFLPQIIGYDDSFEKRLNIEPVAEIYSDNEDFSLRNGGVSSKIRILTYLDFGLTFKRYSLESKEGVNNFNDLSGSIFVYPYDKIFIEGNFSILDFSEDEKYFNTTARAGYNSDFVSGAISFYKGDLVKKIYDSPLTFNRIPSTIYNGEVEFNFPRGMILEIKYDYIKTDEFLPASESFFKVAENIGNETGIVGKIRVFDEYFAGYEYKYADYKYQTEYFYTPQMYKSHSIVAETPAYFLEPFAIRFNGKFGIIPNTNYLVKSAGVEIEGHLTDDLLLTASGKLNWDYRYNQSFQNRQFSFKLNWRIL